MNNTAINRENVQQILDRNAAEAKRKEADLYKQERKLRLIINQNHTDKTAVKAPERPQEEPKKTEEEWGKELTRRSERRAQRAQEHDSCTAWYRFMLLVFAPLIAAGLLVSLAGSAPITFILLTAMVAFTALILLTAIKAFFPKPNFARFAVEAYDDFKDAISEFKEMFRKGVCKV